MRLSQQVWIRLSLTHSNKDPSVSFPCQPYADIKHTYTQYIYEHTNLEEPQ